MKIEADSPGPSVALERRYLTIVFSDLVGYTQLSEQMDPEDLRDLQLRYQREGLTTMEGYGGFVASYSGDGILVYFGYPTAHENDAERAVRAALELVKRVPTLEAKAGAEPGTPLAVRIGVHSGLLVIGAELLSMGRTEFGVVGEAVNLASRLKDEAPVNSVVVSNETLELVEGLFETESLGDRRIRGLSRNVMLHRIIGPRYASGRTGGRMRRGATRMVGREREAEQLLALWRKATQEQRCMMAQVVGEAGVGKTRLIQDFCQRPSSSGATILRMNCLEIFATTPLYAVGQLLLVRASDWPPGTTRTPERQRYRRTSAASTATRRRTAPCSRAWLASPWPGRAVPRQSRRWPSSRSSSPSSRSMSRELCDNKPTVLWIDDAHWLDPSSAELLPRIIERLARAPVLVLADHPVVSQGARAARAGPRYFPRAAAARGMPASWRSPFPGPRRFPKTCWPGRPRPATAFRCSSSNWSSRSSARVRALAAGAGTEDDLPLTLGEIMSERLDRLEGGRRVVQAAACIGRSFAADFLGPLLESADVAVVEPLEALVEAEILRRRRDDDRTTYEFRHALLQRVAYELMIQADRRAMHARIADLLKQRSNSMPAIPEVMAHHLTQAERSQEAITAWLDAAAAASRRSALVEAIAHIRNGLALLDGIREPQVRRQLELSLPGGPHWAADQHQGSDVGRAFRNAASAAWSSAWRASRRRLSFPSCSASSPS